MNDPSLSNFQKTIEKNSRGYVAPRKIVEAVTKAIESNNFEEGLLAEHLLFEGTSISPLFNES